MSQAFPYETMVRQGYVSCMTCHHSLSGGGLLNAYGRVLAGELSTFPGKKLPKKKKWDHGLQLRMSHFKSTARTRTFPMQFDYLSAFKGKKTGFEGTLAKIPKRQNDPQPSLDEQFYIRKALFTYTHNKKTIFQIGRDHLDVGLNLVDHTLFIRSNNKRSVSDFFSVVRGVFYTDTYKIAPYIFFPSFQEDYDNTEKGMGIKVEKYLTSYKTVIAFSQLVGDTSNLKRKESSFSFKTGFKKLYFLGQASFTHRTLDGSRTKFDQNTYLFSSYFYPFESFELQMNVEKLFVSSPFSRRSIRSNHGVKWRLFKNLSLEYNAKRNIDRSDEFQSIYQIYFNGSFL